MSTCVTACTTSDNNFLLLASSTLYEQFTAWQKSRRKIEIQTHPLHCCQHETTYRSQCKIVSPVHKQFTSLSFSSVVNICARPHTNTGLVKKRLMAYRGSSHTRLRENRSMLRSTFCHKLTYNCIGSSLDIIRMYWMVRGDDLWSVVCTALQSNGPSTLHPHFMSHTQPLTLWLKHPQWVAQPIFWLTKNPSVSIKYVHVWGQRCIWCKADRKYQYIFIYFQLHRNKKNVTRSRGN
jgi:hypothetical protein